MRERGSKRGVSLLLALGVMAIFSVMGFTFLLLASMEKSTAERFVERVQTQDMAQTGLQATIAHLQAYFQKHRFFSPFIHDPHNPSQLIDNPLFFRGEDKNWNGILDDGEDLNGNGQLDTFNLPLDPSLDMKPSLEGHLPLTSTTEGHYWVKIVDESGKFWVNDKNPNLQRMLNNLSDILNLGVRLGDKILDHRPEQGYRTTIELRNVLGKSLWNQVSAYLTVYGWADSKVIRPSVGPRQPAPGTTVFAFSQLIRTLPHPGPAVLGERAPVNINAATQPVLQAILMDLKASYPLEFPPQVFQDSYPVTPMDYFNYGAHIAHSTDEKEQRKIAYGVEQQTFIDAAMAHTLSQQLFRLPKPIEGWSQFLHLLFHLHASWNPTLDLLYANANPNTDLLTFNPDWKHQTILDAGQPRDFPRYIDKTDLDTSSTEFSFLSNGYFSIEVLGFLTPLSPSRKNPELSKRPKVLVTSRLQVVLHLFDLYRDTTEADFARGRITPTGLDTTSWGLALQGYPENHPKLWPRTEIDGQLGLAPTTHTGPEPEDTFWASFNRSLDANFATGDPKATVESSSFLSTPEKMDPANTASYSIFNIPRVATPLPDGYYSEPGLALMYAVKGNVSESKVDMGKVFDEAKKNPGFDKSRQSATYFYQLIHGRHPTSVMRGTLSFWFKPNFDPRYPRMHELFMATNPIDKPNPHWLNTFQIMYHPGVGRAYSALDKKSYSAVGPIFHWGFAGMRDYMFADDPAQAEPLLPDLANHERLEPWMRQPNRWYQFVFTWDTTGGKDFEKGLKNVLFEGLNNSDQKQSGNSPPGTANSPSSPPPYLLRLFGQVHSIHIHEPNKNNPNPPQKNPPEHVPPLPNENPYTTSQPPPFDYRAYSQKVFNYFRLNYDDLAGIYLNGYKVTSSLAKKYDETQGKGDPSKGKDESWRNTVEFGPTLQITSDNNFFSLGGRLGSYLWNYPADGTFDEVIISNKPWSSERIQKELTLGRYFRGPAEFTSGAIRLPKDTYALLGVEATFLVPTEGLFPSRHIRIRMDGHQDTVQFPLEAHQETKAWNLRLDPDKKPFLNYQVDFTDNGVGTFETPFLDDITLIFGITPQIVEYFFEES